LLSLIDELIQDVRTARVRFALSRLRAEARRRQETGRDSETARAWLLRRCRAIARLPFEPGEYAAPRIAVELASVKRTGPWVTVVLDGARAAFVRTLPGPLERTPRRLIDWAHGRAAFARLFDTEQALRWEARMLRFAGYDEDTITRRQAARWAHLPRRFAIRHLTRSPAPVQDGKIRSRRSR
jgi:hypothetical protein